MLVRLNVFFSIMALAIARPEPLSASSRIDDTASTFQALEKAGWRKVFSDPGSGNWRDQWFLDGDQNSVENTPDGMIIRAGPKSDIDAGHVVLWTRQSFTGDVRIDFDFTRLDQAIRGVNIVYLCATGQGASPYVKDIQAWADLRKVPAMKLYFDHMNAYHISYAAFANANQDPTADYIRARQYLPAVAQGLAGTDFQPSYSRTGLFGTNVTCHVTIIKKEGYLAMRVQSDPTTWYGGWPLINQPILDSGRIGLRQMNSRFSRYRNFSISLLATEPPQGAK